MESRSLLAGRGGLLVVGWLLFAHLVTGSSMLHAFGTHHAPTGLTSHVTAPAPTGPAAAACSDGGACLVADRATWPPVVVPAGLALFAVIVVLVVLTRTARLRHVQGRGLSPPLHLSARVVLVI